MIDDVRFLVRFQRCRSRPVAWRVPDAEEIHRWQDHPVIGRFGVMYAIAIIAGELWLVRERLWNGWPDPPRFAFFALSEDRIRVAADFHTWPQAWTIPPEADPIQSLDRRT